MTTITEVKLWNDVGFNESDRRVPSLSNLAASLPTPTWSFTNQSINPSVDRLFRELQLPESYNALMYTSYIKVTYSFKNGSSSFAVYGWVDSVECRSDSEDYPMTTIRWHIDYWRTYAATVTYTSGKVERATNLGSLFNRYKQPVTEQYFTASDIVQLTTPSSRWVYMTANFTDDNDVLHTRIYCFPFKQNLLGQDTYIKGYAESTVYKTLSASEIVDGSWTNRLSLEQKNIKYVCFSPLPPIDMTGTGVSGDPVTSSSLVWKPTTEIFTSSDYAVFYLASTSTVKPFTEYDVDLSSYNIKSDELNRYVLTGFDGEVIHEIPFGLSVTGVKIRTVMSSISGYLELRFYSSSLTIERSRANGLCAVVPLLPLELSENSTSAYVYSGQRQYDIDSATTQRDQALVSGIVGIGKSAASGAIAGSVFPVIGQTAGAVGGAAIGLTAAVGGYGASQYFDRVGQGNRDALMVSQPDAMLLSGGGFDFWGYGQALYIRKLTADQESLDHFNNVIANDGYQIGDYVSTGLDTALRSQTGAIQISELKLGGNVPVEAKAYIKRRFANGVILS